MDTSLADPLIGVLLDGRYRVDRRIARGGMATVYAAEDTRLDREVAVKVMHPALADDEQFVARFIREAKAAARLSHPDVVSVFDQGSDATSGRVFLVMELVSGRTLRDVLREHGRLSPAQALSVLEPVLAALGAAHRAGLVHRDVKPENVLLSDDGRVKVADFGLARAIEASHLTSTTGLLIGTVAYLAPEQVATGAADARSDVYAAGIVLYEMLVGTPPYAGETPLAVAYKHVNDDVPAPSESVDGVPARLDGLVLRATSREIEDRPADAATFLTELHRARRDLALPVVGLTAAALGESDDRHDTVALRTPAAAPGPHPTLVTRRTGTTAPPLYPDLDGRDAGGPGDPDPDGPDGQDAPAGPRRRRAGLVALLVVLLLAAGAAGAGWYYGSGRYTTAPSLLGLTAAEAATRADTAGLTITVAEPGPEDFDEVVPAGAVLSQDPGPTERVLRDGVVTLRLSRGPERFAVPTLVGTAEADARAALEAVNLTPGQVDAEFSPDVPAGVVLASTPAEGAELKRGSVVDLVVSKGPPPVEVPDVRGKTLKAAGEQLAGLGLDPLRGDEVFSDSVPAGQVTAQSTAPGDTLPRGAKITLTVSKGPDTVDVPDVTGRSQADARAALTAAGLTTRVVVLLPAGPDTVLRQSPGAGGDRVRRGSEVIVYVF